MNRLGLLFALLLPLLAHADPVSVSKAVEMRQGLDDIALAAANHDLVQIGRASCRERV